ncbi:transposable element Tcb1 transposase [Trichonephila clavipes]|nr:transposable element Tcb1 transposase [Trichonephila clavipes]
MSSRHHIDDFMCGRIIGKIEEGRKITDVAREFDIAHSVVSRLWKSFKPTGMCSRRHRGGRVRSTTPAEDRYIVLSAKRNRCTTAQQVANQFLAASVKQISRKTVARRLRGGGLYVRRHVVCVPLTRQHRTVRLQWCLEHHNWTEREWACVLFSDESRFSLSSDCRRQLIWRENGTAYHPENIQEKDRYPTCSITVWASIMINGRTRLHVVVNGTMTGQRYIDEVLLPHVRLFRGAVGDKLVFMEANATCHRTLAVQDCLDSEGIQRLVWPARSPDLNPIKMCGVFWGGKLLIETILQQTRTPSSVHSQRNGINCLNSCWIMLCNVCNCPAVYNFLISTSSSSCASASSSNARELDEQILEVKINPQEKNTVSDTSTNRDTLSKEKESENENEETKLIRNDFAHYVGTPIDADLREQILKLGPYQPQGNFQKDAKGRSFSSSYYSFISKAGQNRKEMAVLFNTTSCCLLSGMLALR